MTEWIEQYGEAVAAVFNDQMIKEAYDVWANEHYRCDPAAFRAGWEAAVKRIGSVPGRVEHTPKTEVDTMLNQAAVLMESASQKCSHPNLEGSYGSNTSNWCSQDVCYWLDLHCPDCGWRTSVDGDTVDYRLYSPYGNGQPGYNFKRVK